MAFKIGNQVSWRQQTQSKTMSIIRTGNIVSMKGSKATVHFPAENVRREIPVSDLESTSVRYPGRSSVNINPIRR